MTIVLLGALFRSPKKNCVEAQRHFHHFPSSPLRRRRLASQDGRQQEWGRLPSMLEEERGDDDKESIVFFERLLLELSVSSMPPSTPAPSVNTDDLPSVIPSVLATKVPTAAPVDQTLSSPPSISASPTLPLPYDQWEPVEKAQEGRLVALSGDGLTMAVGIHDVGVRVFTEYGSQQIGSTIESPPIAPDDDFLNLVSIALSDDGSRLAIATMSGRNSLEGGTQQRRGTIRVFDLLVSAADGEESEWIQVGSNIEGQPFDQLGYSVSLSSDGSSLSAGSPFGPGGFGEGFVMTMKYDDASAQWMQLGNTIVPPAADEKSSGFGWTSEISGDGQRIVIGEPFYNTKESTWIGRAFVFSYDDASALWVQLSEIVGSINLDQFGVKVSISGDGNTIAITSLASAGAVRGQVRIYRYQESTSTFEQLGDTLEGAIEPNIFGEDMDLSQDGNTIAIGDTQVGAEGVVSIHQYDATNWQTTGEIFGATDGSQGTLGQSVAMSNDGNFVALSFVSYPSGISQAGIYAPVE